MKSNKKKNPPKNRSKAIEEEKDLQDETPSPSNDLDDSTKQLISLETQFQANPTHELAE